MNLSVGRTLVCDVVITCACFSGMGRDFGGYGADSVPRSTSSVVPFLDSEHLPLFYSFTPGPTKEVLISRK